jgi:hypothetical protein
MPDPDKKEWYEELGFKSAKEYHDAQNAKIDKLTKSNEALQADLDKKATEDAEKVAADKKAAEELAKKEEPKEVTEDDYKIKATTLYASLSDEERQSAEGVIAKLPKDIQAVAQTSFEAKYMILSEMYPNAQESADDGSVFGALKKEAAKVSATDLIKKAMAELKGTARGNPESFGSGFVQKKGKTPDGEGTEAPLFNVMGGLYVG